MEKNLHKCSLLHHKENNAISFCQECKIYMCNKCEKHHSELFLSHHQYNFDKEKNDINEIFTGLCKEKNHPNELRYFCKTHNQLCCSECITKIKGLDFGQHSDCTVCTIHEIENEKKSKLNENIKYLEGLSINLKESINELKLIFEKVEKNKEEVKIDIQKFFTKLRNKINEREDELLIDVDKKFNELYLNEETIKEIEDLPNMIQISIEKGKLLNSNKDINLISLINDCLNIEQNINEINKRNLNLKEFKLNEYKIEFILNEKESNFFEKKKKFGEIYKSSHSQIINDKDFNKINEWVGGKNKFFIKYNAKKDGCDPNIFHEKCDGIGKCIIICKVYEGDIIGGYISTNIIKKEEFSYDDKAFLFNLSKNIVKINKTNYSKAVKNFSNSSKFIKFGDCDVFILSGNCLNNKESQVRTCSCGCNFDCEKLNILNQNGSQNFRVENFEVFQVN